MSKFRTYAEKIRNLVAEDDIDAAIDSLRGLLQNSPKLDEAIIQSARNTDIEKQIRTGTIGFEQASVTKNQIRTGILSLLREIEKQADADPSISKEVESALHEGPVQAISTLKNAVIHSTIQADKVEIGDHISKHYYHDNTKKLQFLNENLSRPHPYVSRRIALVPEKNLDRPLPTSGISILEEIDSHKRTVLLSEAGVGKSTELQKIGYEYQKLGLRIALLRLKNYNPLPYFSLSEADIADIENRVVLFDGLDEVNIKEAHRRISEFSSGYPNLRILVSCRSNLYQNTLDGFACFRLEKFSGEEIGAFLDQVIPVRKQHFLNIIPNPEIKELFKIPFFLEKAVQYYRNNDFTLPESKTELLEYLIQESLYVKLGDGTTIPENKEFRKRCEAGLSKVAFVMECLGINNISQSSITEILPDPDELKLILKNSSLIEYSHDNFQFTHRIIQEYLAAKVLSRAKNVRQVKRIVALPKSYRHIKRTWLNTLSDLLSIWDRNDKKKMNLLFWLIEAEPEILVFFEKEKIPLDVREKVFQKILKQYNKEGRVFDYRFFSPRDLVELAGNRSTFGFVYNELKKAKKLTSKVNALTILRYFTSHHVPSDLRKALRASLFNHIYDFENSTPYLRHLAIECFLNYFKDIPEEEASKLVATFFNAYSPYERMSAYSAIRMFRLQRRYMEDLLLRMLQLHDPEWRKEDNLMDEDYRLEECFKALSSKDDIISFFEAYPTIFEKLNVTSKDPLPEVLNQAFASSFSKADIDKIFASMKEIFAHQLLSPRWRINDQILMFLRNNRILSRLIDFCLKSDAFCYPLLIASVAEEDTIELITIQVQEGNLSREWIRSYLIALGRKDQTLLDRHLAALNETVIPPIERPGEIYFNSQIGKAMEEEKLRATKALFFSKAKFVEAFRSVFAEFGVEKFSKGEIFRAHSDYLKENEFHEKYPWFILQLIDGNTQFNMEELIEQVEKNWDLISMRELKRYLENQKEVQLDQKEISYIKSWCDTQATSFLSGDNPTEDIHFVYYILKFKFCDYPADTYLKMVGSGIQNNLPFGMDIIPFIEKRNLVALESLEIKILENLKNQVVRGYERKQYFDYVKEKKLKRAAPILKPYIESGDLGTRHNALNLYLEVGGDLDYLLDLVWELPSNDDLEPSLVEYLIRQRPAEILGLVEERFFSSQEKAEKLRYAKQLIRLNQLEGLKYLVQHVEAEKKYPFDSFRESLDFNFVNPKGIPILFRLYNLGNDPTIPQDSFNSLSRFAGSQLSHLAISEEGKFFEDVCSYAVKYYRHHSLLNKLPGSLRPWFRPAFPATLDQLKYFLEDLQRAYAQDQKMELQEALRVYHIIN